MIGAQLAGLYGGGAAPANTAYESIATVTVGLVPTSTITFSSIPSTYKHLQIRAIARGTAATTEIQWKMNFNGSSASYWANHQLFGNGTSAVGDADGSTGFIYSGYTTATTAASNVFGATVTDILDYSNTNKNKVARTLTGFDTNGGGYIFLRSGLWMNTAAITQIDLTPSTGNWGQYSSFALYGIKG